MTSQFSGEVKHCKKAGSYRWSNDQIEMQNIIKLEEMKKRQTLGMKVTEIRVDMVS